MIGLARFIHGGLEIPSYEYGLLRTFPHKKKLLSTDTQLIVERKWPCRPPHRDVVSLAEVPCKSKL